MATVMRKPGATSKWEPKSKSKLTPNRHHRTSTALDPSSDDSRRGSAVSKSSSKGSGSEPAWMSSIRDRDPNNSSASAESAPDTSGRRRSSLSGLFGRRQSLDERSSATKNPTPKVVLGSKYAVQAQAKTQNVLKADPRGARKHPSTNTSTGATKAMETEGLPSKTHITAAEQEARHPHSGPPALYVGGSDLPMLTKIVSMDEPSNLSVDEGTPGWIGRSRSKQGSEFDLVHESQRQPKDTQGTEYKRRSQVAPDRIVGNGPEDNEVIDHATGRPRRKSLLDVEIRAADRPRPSTKGKMWGGGWHRDEQGNWTRK